MSLMTIAGTPVEIKVSKAGEGGWIALGRILEGVLPGTELVEANGSSCEEAESRCRDRLERLIHARTCGSE
ncbi:MAG TPA: hypothetical protein VMX94_08570 [Armatimonadota bacterium]|nr:hypothetical protein [Armatimonadota bacterium]